MHFVWPCMLVDSEYLFCFFLFCSDVSKSEEDNTRKAMDFIYSDLEVAALPDDNRYYFV